MSIPSNNPARRWAAELRAWNGYWWNRFRSWLTDGGASTLAFAATMILFVLVGLLTLGRGSAPKLLGGAFTVEVTDEGVLYVALDPEALGQAQGGAAKDGASRGSGPSAVALFSVELFSVDTSGGVLSLVGGEGLSAGNDPQPPPDPKPGPGPSPVPSPGPSPSPTPNPSPPPTTTEPPPTSTEPPPTSTEPPPTSTEPPPTSTEPPPTSTEPPPTSTEPPPTSTEPPEPSRY